MDKQVVSKKRVAAHGEVLIGKREVNAMLDVFFPPPLEEYPLTGFLKFVDSANDPE